MKCFTSCEMQTANIKYISMLMRCYVFMYKFQQNLLSIHSFYTFYTVDESINFQFLFQKKYKAL